MAIVNTFPRCLDSPYLVRDPDAPLRVGDLLALAADRLDAATNLFESRQGDQADVSFFSYETMFACIRALVYRHGYRELGLRCLLLACEHLYVSEGLLDPALLVAFERAQGLKTPPGENLRAASAIVKRTLELLEATDRPVDSPSPAADRA
jgi:hypothetical protein